MPPKSCTLEDLNPGPETAVVPESPATVVLESPATAVQYLCLSGGADAAFFQLLGNILPG